MNQMSIERGQRMLRLYKKGHEYRLMYADGDERAVLEALTEMVRNPSLAFDWFDAAVMSHQLGEHLAKELGGFLPKKAA